MPKFSIVIPCFNAATTLAATLDSIRAQTCASWEIICVDDGSTDLTRDIVRDAASEDQRIKGVANLAKGPSSARNMGARIFARGEIIAFCDADDIWSPTKLAELDAAFSDPDVDGAFGKIAFFNDDPKDATVYSTVPANDLTIPMLLGENPVCTMSNIAVRRGAFVVSDGFNTDLVHNEDLEWLIRLVGGGARIVGINSCQTYYRASPRGLSADLKDMARSRQIALKSAARFGFAPTAMADAIYLRFLARRALRLGYGRFEALKYALRGVCISPKGFFSSPRRGGLTLIGAFVSLFLPNRLNQVIFSR